MNNTLPEKIMEEIKKQGIEPRPRWHFLLKRSVLWSLAAIATIFGGIAVAVIIFIFIDHDANARAYLNESIFIDLLETIPYLWFGTLLLLIGITQYVIRHTKSGYRYTAARIVGTVVVSSVVIGIVLSALEVGERVQDFFVERAPNYDKITNTSKDAWSHPEKGLLGGTVTEVVSSEEIKLTDFHDKIWFVDRGQVDATDGPVIQLGAKIKLIGTIEDNSTFRAVRVFSWK